VLLTGGAFDIFALLLVWNFSLILSILLWKKERSRRSGEKTSTATSFSGLVRTSSSPSKKKKSWSQLKKEAQQLENQIQKTRDLGKRRALQGKLRSLLNDLRRLEWSIREESMDAIPSSRPDEDEDKYSNYNGESSSPFMHGNSNSAGQRKNSKENWNGEPKERRQLERILKLSLEVITNEPEDSLASVLALLSNELRAHYNEIKKRKIAGNVSSIALLGDYWATLMVLHCAIRKTSIDFPIAKYVSKEYSEMFSRFVSAAVEKNRIVLAEKKNSSLAREQDYNSLDTKKKLDQSSWNGLE
jgi:hypothetical protein